MFGTILTNQFPASKTTILKLRCASPQPDRIAPFISPFQLRENRSLAHEPIFKIHHPPRLPHSTSSWWFQPISKILVKLNISPNRGENKNCFHIPHFFLRENSSILQNETKPRLPKNQARTEPWSIFPHPPNLRRERPPATCFEPVGEKNLSRHRGGACIVGACWFIEMMGHNQVALLKTNPLRE